MHLSNEEARRELEEMRKARDLTEAAVSRRTGRSAMWVHRKLSGDTRMTLDDYGVLYKAIVAVPPMVPLIEPVRKK